MAHAWEERLSESEREDLDVELGIFRDGGMDEYQMYNLLTETYKLTSAEADEFLAVERDNDE